MTGKSEYLSNFDKSEIVTAQRLEMSISETAHLVGCSHAVVLSTYRMWFIDSATTSLRLAAFRPRRIDSKKSGDCYALFVVNEKLQQRTLPTATTVATQTVLYITQFRVHCCVWT